MLLYSIVELWILNLSSRATPKTKISPVRQCMLSCEVVYKDIFIRLTVKNSI